MAIISQRSVARDRASRFPGRRTVHALIAVLLGLLALPVAGVAVPALLPAASANGVPLAKGDVLASVGSGLVKNFSPTGTLQDTLDTTTGSQETAGGCFDSAGNFYVTSFQANAMSKFDHNGNLLVANFGSSFNQHPESCTVDGKDHIYVGQADGSRQILEFDTSGNLLNSFSPATDARGTDWIDLAADQCTIYYTGEGTLIKRFNVCTNTQLPDFASGLPAPCFALRIRPDGEVIVACSSEAVRLDPSGNVLQTYSIPSSSSLFAMNLDPDGSTFWTGDQGNGEISRIDIATGKVITQFNSSPNPDLAGLSLVGEIAVSQPPPPPTGCSSRPTVTHVFPLGNQRQEIVKVLITGKCISGATHVMFGSVPASSFTVTGKNILAAPPQQLAGTVDVTVTTPGGTSAVNPPADHYTYYLPTITLVAPNHGPVTGGETVLIRGSMFSGTPTPTVSFGSGNFSTSVVVNSDTTIHAVVPPHTAGTVDVQVTAFTGTSLPTAADHYTYK